MQAREYGLGRIEKVCREAIKDAVKKLGVYTAEVDYEIHNGTYFLKFKVGGSSGEVTYKTPVFKVGEEELVNPEEYREYCRIILDKLADIATEEY